MKNKKITAYIIIGLFTLGLLSSCAIDRKCPAYTNAMNISTNEKAV